MNIRDLRSGEKFDTRPCAFKTLCKVFAGFFLFVRLQLDDVKQLLLTADALERDGPRGAETELWVAGDGGTLINFAANKWTTVTGGKSFTLRSMYGFSANDIWAVGDAGTIVHYDGSGWQPWTSKKDVTANEQLLAIWGNGSNLWAVSAQGTP